MNNNIIIELCTEDRARLDRIAALLEAQTTQEVKTASKPEIKPTAHQKIEAKASEQPKQEEASAPNLEPLTDEEIAEALDIAVEEAKKNEAQKNQEVKLEDIQRLVVKLATSGKKAEAKEVVTDYAPSVTALPVDKYGEVYRRLQKIGG